MKKYTLIALVCFFIYGEAIAQDKFPQELAVGASFGMNFSSVVFAPKISTKLMPGYTGGLMIRWNTHKNLGLQAEVNYSIQGWEEDFEDFRKPIDPTVPEANREPELSYKRELSYIELPIMTHIYFGTKTFKFYINAGPKIAYYMSQKSRGYLDLMHINKVSGSRVTEHYNMKVKNKFDWGLCGGPGIELNTKAGIFLLEGRFSYSFNDIFSTRKGLNDPFTKASNQVISVKIAYLFPILK